MSENKEITTYPFLAFVSFEGSKKVYSFGSESDDYHVDD